MVTKIKGVTFFAGGKFNVTVLEPRRSGCSKTGEYEGYGFQSMTRGIWGITTPEAKSALIDAVKNNKNVELVYDNTGSICAVKVVNS